MLADRWAGARGADPRNPTVGIDDALPVEGQDRFVAALGKAFATLRIGEILDGERAQLRNRLRLASQEVSLLPMKSAAFTFGRASPASTGLYSLSSSAPIKR